MFTKTNKQIKEKNEVNFAQNQQTAKFQINDPSKCGHLRPRM